jgi:hypothetical protein
MTEPQPPTLRRLQHKASGHTRDVTILRAPAEDLPFDNGCFDVAVSGLHPGSGLHPRQVRHTTLPRAPEFVSPAIMGAATTPSPAPARPSPLASGSSPG